MNRFPPDLSGVNSVPAYAVADIRVHDPALFSRYVDRIGEIVRKHRGRYLARAGR